MVSFLPNPWLPLIEQDPSVAFATFAPSRRDRRRDFSPNFLDFVLRQRGPAFSEFQGEQGRQILRGDAPTLTFSQFLQDTLNPAEFLRRFEQLDPRARGETPARFAPRLRFNV